MIVREGAGAVPSGHRHLGVDVGGSATRVAVLDGSGERTASLPGGSLGLDPRTIGGVLDELLAVEDPWAVCVGVPGVRSFPDRAAALRESLARRCPRVEVLSDAELALFAAFGEDDGIVLSAGTGVVAAIRTAGRVEVVGGHGFLLGDRGGAYALGRALLSAALVERDRGVRALADDIEVATGVSLELWVARVYASPADRAPLASLARLATALDHPAARAVVADAAGALSEVVELALGRFGELPVAVRGGVMEVGVIREQLERRFGVRWCREEPARAAARRARSEWP